MEKYPRRVGPAPPFFEFLSSRKEKEIFFSTGRRRSAGETRAESEEGVRAGRVGSARPPPTERKPSSFTSREIDRGPDGPTVDSRSPPAVKFENGVSGEIPKTVPRDPYGLHSSLDDHGGGGAEPPDRFGEGPVVLGGGRMNLISKSLWPLADVTISEETSHEEGDDDVAGGVKSHVSLDGSQ